MTSATFTAAEVRALKRLAATVLAARADAVDDYQDDTLALAHQARLDARDARRRITWPLFDAGKDVPGVCHLHPDIASESTIRRDLDAWRKARLAERDRRDAENRRSAARSEG